MPDLAAAKIERLPGLIGMNISIMYWWNSEVICVVDA
jgi:hypothetical protein